VSRHAQPEPDIRTGQVTLSRAHRKQGERGRTVGLRLFRIKDGCPGPAFSPGVGLRAQLAEDPELGSQYRHELGGDGSCTLIPLDQSAGLAEIIREFTHAAVTT
jgi:hypothetical protein